MLPPVLEIYVVWHPADHAGAVAADELANHFHGSTFTGLIGGAVEVYVRSHGWRGPDDSPRPIPVPGAPPPNGLAQARLTAIVPILGMELAGSVEPGIGAWHDYVSGIRAAQEASPDCVGVYPLWVDEVAHETQLGRILGRYQSIGRLACTADAGRDTWCRDLAQGIAQQAANTSQRRLSVFISHTKRTSRGADDTRTLVDLVRATIGQTRLAAFFDASDLQPGAEWSEDLHAAAAAGALLAIRTDLYASRMWCQREMRVAKCAGMPVVVLDALSHGEERGSFLMDHVPRVPVRRRPDGWRVADVHIGLNLLVDECLKRALWRHQRELAAARPDLDIAWWAPHAPEPATLAAWLAERRQTHALLGSGALRILHPDPPLGEDERLVLHQIAAINGTRTPLDIMTPRQLAARGG